MPESWYCIHNTELRHNSCEQPQELTDEQIDAEINNTKNAPSGTVVPIADQSGESYLSGRSMQWLLGNDVDLEACSSQTLLAHFVAPAGATEEDCLLRPSGELGTAKVEPPSQMARSGAGGVTKVNTNYKLCHNPDEICGAQSSLQVATPILHKRRPSSMLGAISMLDRLD